MESTAQLREELYDVAKEKLVLEEKIKALNFFINALKKELDQRTSYQIN